MARHRSAALVVAAVLEDTGGLAAMSSEGIVTSKKRR